MLHRAVSRVSRRLSPISSITFSPTIIQPRFHSPFRTPRVLKRDLSSTPNPKPEEKPRTEGPVSWSSLMLLVAAGCGVLIYFNIERERRKREAGKRVESVGEALLGGPFELVDQDGRGVTDASYRGDYLMLYFGFTFCPDICPNELVKLGRAVDLVSRRKDLPRLRPVFISVDPRRDTVEQMRVYAKDFHPDLVALTGTPGQVSRVSKAYRVYFSDVDASDEDEDDYVVDHSIALYLIGPDGKFIDFFPQLAEADEIAERVIHTMEQRQGGGGGNGFVDKVANFITGRK